MSDSTQPTSQTPSQPSAAAPAPAASPEPVAAPASPDTPTTASATPAAPAAEAKPADAKPAEAAKPEGAQPPAPAVPEKYDFKIPEGDAYKGVKLDEAMTGAMAPAFKAANLTQDQANGLVKTFLDYQLGLPKAMLARDLEVTLKDATLGGMNWGKTQGYVNEALGAFTTPEFRAKLERWGIANDTEFVRVFSAIGRAMRGDVPERGQPTTAEESQADRIYGRVKKVGNS